MKSFTCKKSFPTDSTPQRLRNWVTAKDALPDYIDPNDPDPMLHICLVHGDGHRWYLADGAPDNAKRSSFPDDFLCEGLAVYRGNERSAEMGAISLRELESVKPNRFMLGIERDLEFKPTRLSEIMAQL